MGYSTFIGCQYRFNFEWYLSAKYIAFSDALRIIPNFKTMINLKVQSHCNLISTGHLTYPLAVSKVTILLILDVIIRLFDLKRDQHV